jgi:hypothetical protein
VTELSGLGGAAVFDGVEVGLIRHRWLGRLRIYRLMAWMASVALIGLIC